MDELKLHRVGEQNGWAHLQTRFEEYECQSFDSWKLVVFRYCLEEFSLDLVVGEVFFQGDTPPQYFEDQSYSYAVFPIGIHEGAFYNGQSYQLSRIIEDDHEMELAIDSGCVIGISPIHNNIRLGDLVGCTTNAILPVVCAMPELRVLALFGHDGLRFDLYLKQELLFLVARWM